MWKKMSITDKMDITEFVCIKRRRNLATNHRRKVGIVILNFWASMILYFWTKVMYTLYILNLFYGSHSMFWMHTQKVSLYLKTHYIIKWKHVISHSRFYMVKNILLNTELNFILHVKYIVRYTFGIRFIDIW